MANFLPPDLEQEQADIGRQRAYAQMLRQQAQAPQGQMVGDRYVAPSITQYLASALSGYKANQKETSLDARQKALGEALSGRRKEFINSMPQAAPAQTMEMGDIDPSLAQYGPIETKAATNPSTQDYMQWAMKGMNVDPQLAQFGFKMADSAEARQSQTEARKEAMQQRFAELQMRAADARASQAERLAAQQEAARLQREFQAQMAAESRAHQAGMARLTASMRPEPNPNLVQVEGPDGKPIYIPAAQAVGRTPARPDKGPGNATEDERKAAGWLAQADKAYKDMEEATMASSKAAHPGVIESLPIVPESFKNTTRSPERQKFVQGASAFSEATLRAATGAGVTKDEAIQKVRELTPQWGDSAQVIAQKKASTQMYLESLQKRAGRAAPPGYTPPQASAPQPAGKNIVVDW